MLIHPLYLCVLTEKCCWHKNSLQIFLLYEMAAVFICPNTRHRRLFTALFMSNAISRYNAHISMSCLHSRTRKNTRNSFWNAFLKRSPPLLRDLSLSLSLVGVLYAAHYATQFLLTQAVCCQLLVLLTLNFYCCKPLTVWEKRNYFLPVDVFCFHILILSSESHISWSWLWRDHWIQVCHLLSSQAALLEWDG